MFWPSDILAGPWRPGNRLLMAHLNGDYGLVTLDTHDFGRTNEARKEGRQFTGVFIVDSYCIKV
jgi:hypothetical protein